LRLLSRADATPEVIAQCRAALDDQDPRVVRAAQDAILRLDRAQRAGRRMPVRDLGPLTAADVVRRRAVRRRM
jgi:hypothetical protein